MKKTLLALSTTAVVAIGGAGIAAADEPAGDTPTGSITNLPSGDAAGSLESFAGAAKSISGILKAVNTLITAGGNVENVVSDTQDFLGATGN
ncbi:hypothetical protein [Corynebacterium sp.]|uniref:hypothetical protein n=1 Tax=Corynebacterium sp. TaxID=1720 RepID=UPI0025BDDF4C|nr:hypothetical protein [Corynebacterium sp.]